MALSVSGFILQFFSACVLQRHDVVQKSENSGISGMFNLRLFNIFLESGSSRCCEGSLALQGWSRHFLLLFFGLNIPRCIIGSRLFRYSVKISRTMHIISLPPQLGRITLSPQTTLWIFFPSLCWVLVHFSFLHFAAFSGADLSSGEEEDTVLWRWCLLPLQTGRRRNVTNHTFLHGGYVWQLQLLWRDFNLQCSG